MNCPKCNAPLEEGDQFCPQCGALIPEETQMESVQPSTSSQQPNMAQTEENVTDTLHTQTTKSTSDPTASTATQSADAQGQPGEAVPQSQPMPTQSERVTGSPTVPPAQAVPSIGSVPPVSPKRKKNKWLLALVIAVIIVALAGVGVYAYPMIRRAVIGESRYFVEQMQARTQDAASLFLTDGEVPAHVEYSASTALSGSLVQNMGTDIDELLNALNFRFSMDQDKNAKKQVGSLGIYDNDDPLVSLRLLTDQNKSAIGLYNDPSLLYLNDTDTEQDLFAQTSLEAITGLDAQGWQTLTESYLDTIFASLPDTCISKGNGIFGDLQCETVTFSFASIEAQRSLYTALADQLENDTVLRDTLYHIGNYFFEDFFSEIAAEGLEVPSSVEDKIDEALDSLVAQLRDMAQNPQPLSGTYSVTAYYTGRAQLVAQRITFTEGNEGIDLLYGGYVDGGKLHVLVQELQSGLELQIDGAMTRKTMQGTYALEVAGLTFDGNFDLQKETVGGMESWYGSIDGRFDLLGITFQMNLQSERVDENNAREQLAFTISSGAEDLTLQIDLALKCSDTPQLDELSDLDQAQEIDFDDPEQSESMMQDWSDAVTEKLDAAAHGEQIKELLEAIMSGSAASSDDEYDGDYYYDDDYYYDYYDDYGDYYDYYDDGDMMDPWGDSYGDDGNDWYDSYEMTEDPFAYFGLPSAEKVHVCIK